MQNASHQPCWPAHNRGPLHSQPSMLTVRWRPRLPHCSTILAINLVAHTFWVITQDPTQTRNNNEQKHFHSEVKTNWLSLFYITWSTLNPNTCLYFVSTDAEDLVSGGKAEKITSARNNGKRDAIQIEYARYLLRRERLFTNDVKHELSFIKNTLIRETSSFLEISLDIAKTTPTIVSSIYPVLPCIRRRFCLWSFVLLFLQGDIWTHNRSAPNLWGFSWHRS